MSSKPHQVKVELGSRGYSIRIGTGLLPRLGRECRALGLDSRCMVISDELVAQHYGAPAVGSLEKAGFTVSLLVVPAGERSKNLKTAGRCYQQLAAHRMERKSFVVALGGGVVGDLAGFVAATYLRGIPFVQVPTSLLAQVDSSVGGKVGINLAAAKNLVGAFHQPRLVLCDLDTLRTLPDREYRSGLAEVIKYGVIQDAAFFAFLEKNLSGILAQKPSVLAKTIARCCEIKAYIVGQDEFESGARALLNFGHTVGHAIEAVAGYGRFLHGEAIALGMVAAASISVARTSLPATSANRLSVLLQRAGLPTQFVWHPRLRSRLWDAMVLDKKVSRGELRFVLASDVGQCRFGLPVPALEVNAALDHLAGRPPSKP
jgi:3-dehydroquinate synthase